MSLEIDSLSLSAGTFRLESISLKVGTGQTVALMGPSGCGKTTLLEAICGLGEAPLRGRIMLDGTEINDLPPWKRGMGLVPQDLALFPHLKVRDHLEFVPRLKKWKRSKMKVRVDELAAKLGLDKLLDRGVSGLSGGEAKRVALGRAIVARPRVLCLDEALSGLDQKRHEEVLEVVRGIVREERITTLLVTHSKVEAEALADQVLDFSSLVTE